MHADNMDGAVTKRTIFFTLLRKYGIFSPSTEGRRGKKYLELAAQGDMDARNKLIEHNLRLVAHIIKKYYTQTGDQDDLISIGTIGLIKGFIQMRREMRGNQVKSRKNMERYV